MPVPIDPNALYTVADIREMFDVSEAWIRGAMASPVQRLEAARIGATVYVRGDHLLKYFATLIPDSPTALTDVVTRDGDIEGEAAADRRAASLGLLRTGQFEMPDAPKVLSGQVKEGRLVRPVAQEPPAPRAPSRPDGEGKAPSAPPSRAPDPDATMHLPDAAAFAAAHLAEKARVAAAAASQQPHGAPAAGTGAAAPSPGGRDGAPQPGIPARPTASYNVDDLLREAERIARERDDQAPEPTPKPSTHPGVTTKDEEDLDRWL